MNKIKKSILSTFNALKKTIPILLGVVLLISLAISLIPKSFYLKLFTGNVLLDSLIGGVFGSIAAGNPITSYVIGGELMVMGISMVAIASFILCWVSVGILQIPAEILMLGKKFTIYRNVVSFIFAIIIAIIIGGLL